jgi:transposase InsO family protein
LLGESHLRQVLQAIERHHNTQRPHQGIGNIVPVGFDYPEDPAPRERVQCESGLGGLLNHYSVKKAA